jgi:hypothetical protein
MGVSDPEFPASKAFDTIESGLAGSEADRKDAIKKGGAIFAFTLKNKAGKQESWHLDLKKEGKVGKGLAPAGEKPNGAPPRPCMRHADSRNSHSHYGRREL